MAYEWIRHGIRYHQGSIDQERIIKYSSQAASHLHHFNVAISAPCHRPTHRWPSMRMNKARSRRSPRAPRFTMTWNSSASSSPELPLPLRRGAEPKRFSGGFWVPFSETWGGPKERTSKNSCQERNTFGK